MCAPRLLHRCRTALLGDKKDDGAHAHQDVYEPLKGRHAAQDHVHDVPVATHEPAKADKAPVERTDDNQDERDTVKCFHVERLYE